MKKAFLLSFSSVLSLFVMAHHAYAHGMAGDRIFPSTLTVEDPFVADMLMLPHMHYQKMKSDDGMKMEHGMMMMGLTKTITPDFGISVKESYLMHRMQGTTERGFSNVTVGAAYQLFKSAPHEFSLLGRTDWEIGNTGSDAVGTNAFSTFTPALVFGKGFGDVPASLAYVKPFAVTGSLGYSLPTESFSNRTDMMGMATSSRNPHTLFWGGTVQYSIPYLQEHVKHVAFLEPLDSVIPIVEFAFETPTDGVEQGNTTGTINPGFIWMGHSAQYAIEAVIPVNRQSGDGIGVVGHVHFFLDHLFPDTIGQPVWGRK